jgi:hypothetical protein
MAKYCEAVTATRRSERRGLGISSRPFKRGRGDVGGFLYPPLSISNGDPQFFAMSCSNSVLAA